MVQLKVTRGNYIGYTVLTNPADADIDMDGFDITDADDYIFRETGQEIRSTVAGIDLRLPISDTFNISINNTTEWNFSSTELQTNANNINFGQSVNGQGQVLESLSGGLDLNLPNADDFDIWIDDSGGTLQIEYTFSASKLDLWGNYVEFTEATAPANGSADTARLYAKDNGAGKTQLAVKFSSGAEQILATQP